MDLGWYETTVHSLAGANFCAVLKHIPEDVDDDDDRRTQWKTRQSIKSPNASRMCFPMVLIWLGFFKGLWGKRAGRVLNASRPARMASPVVRLVYLLYRNASAACIAISALEVTLLVSVSDDPPKNPLLGCSTRTRFVSGFQ